MAELTAETDKPLFEQHGSFTDKFMYKYLSAFLASMRPPSGSSSTWTSPEFVTNSTSNPIYYDEYETENTVDFDYTNTFDGPASLLTLGPQNFGSFVSQSSPLAPPEPATTIATDLEWRENISFPDWVSRNFDEGNFTDLYHYPLPLPHTVAIILAGTLLSIVTTGGNLMVIMSFKLEKQLQTISNYFLFSLAVADLTIGVISIPLMTFYTAEGQWTLGYTTCQFWLSIDYLMSNASVMNLLLISFDRYFSVTRPLTYRPRRTSKKAMIMIAATFLISLVLWPPLIIAWPHIEAHLYHHGEPIMLADNECIVQFLKTNSLVTLCTATAAFYGPVIIMVILYSRVYYVTRTRQRELVKLQAFHQQSVRRSDEKLVQDQAPVQRAISSSIGSNLVRKTSNYSKTGPDPVLSGEGADSELITTFKNTCNNHSFRSRGPSDSRNATRLNSATLQKIEVDAKPWGIQALLDHFSKVKQVTGGTPRKGSLASSGFEEDDSYSLASGENTISEAFPLRSSVKVGGPQPGLHSPLSPTPSDYGSTLANQFVNHVRQSFMIKRKGPPGDKTVSRHMSLVPASKRSTKRQQGIDQAVGQPSNQPSQHRRQRSKNAGSSVDPAHSPIQELRKMSAAARMAGARYSAGARSVSRQHSTPKTHSTTPGANEQSKPPETDQSAGGSSITTPSTPAQNPSAYTVLIQLGQEQSEVSTTAEVEPPERPTETTSPVSVRSGTRGSWRGSRPIITLHENAALDQTYLTPDRATSAPVEELPPNTGSGPGVGPGSGGSSGTRNAVRRLSSCSSAVSDAASLVAPPASPLVIANRGISLDNDNSLPAAGAAGLSSRLNISMGGIAGIASRLSSMRGFPPGAEGLSGSSRQHQRKKRGERRQQESKAARTLSAILLAFIVTWTPYNLIVCIESFYPGTVPEFWFTFSYYLCYLNSTINPVLYALCNATFRRTFWRIMTCKWTPVKPSHRPSSHHAAAAIAAVAVAAANRRQSATTITTMR